ncbi:MAG: type VI secretion system baseplate subunit TssF [Treponema sp.]|jgi:type VI secretion system VasI/ImpG family protein|nr:type VI secretion system baseplate subunit TssF [Treponema sp.]
MELLDYYRDNLTYLRNLAAEFAAEFPKIAGRLGLGEFECEDPYIERLLEGTAFLSARVEKKLDEGYRNLLESVLNSVAPSALYPIPAGAVLELILNYSNEQVRAGVTLAAGTKLDAFIPTINIPCTFSTVEDRIISSLAVSEAEYITRSLSDFDINNPQGLAGLRIKFTAAGGMGSSFPKRLTFYINLSEADASLLLRQVMHETVALYVRSREMDRFVPLSGVTVDMPLAAGTKLFPDEIKGHVLGLRVLQNFLAYPAFFKFFTLNHLDHLALSSPNVHGVELLLVFKRREPSLVSLKGSSLKLNCVPGINLFAKRADRVSIEQEAYQFHVIPDRSAPRDYEVVQVERLEFFNEQNESLFFADNFYEDNPLAEKTRKNFFSQRRRKSLVNPRLTQRSSYDGTEVFVSFSVQDKKIEGAYQFAAETICSNRDLSLLLPAEISLISHSPFLSGGFFMTRPTRPEYSFFERGDASDFSQLSHMVFNLSALWWQNGQFPLEALRTLVGSYQIRSGEEMERMVEGLVSLERESTVFRFFKQGVVFFEVGWKVRFTLDETAYAGIGYYVFGRVLAEVLMSFSPLNTPLEIHFVTKQSGRIAVWKTLED